VPFVGNVEALAVEDSLVYFVTDGPIFGIHRLGESASTTLSIVGAEGTAVGVNGDIVYVLSTNRGMHMVNASDPTTPITIGAFTVEGSGVKVLQAEGYTYFVTSNRFPGAENGVAIYDTEFPAIPRPVSFIRFSDGYLYKPVDAALSGSVLYVALGRGGVQVIDVSDPMNPVRIGEVASTAMSTGVAVAAGIVFIADDVGGLITVPADECAPSP
ncbi:MAG: hypothetical protein KAT30_00440, partial [Candidatus Krumholzibacteria bacterium]|nr:hypothetical protein [Candidatus Krumholzibacteria bacterium]